MDLERMEVGEMEQDHDCSGMDELSYCEHWCGELTTVQKSVLEHHKEQDTFIGVGRAVGRSIYMPLVEIGKTANVIDQAGHYQLSAVPGRRSFEWEVKS